MLLRRAFHARIPSDKVSGVGPLLGAAIAAGFYKFIKMLEYETANPGQDDDGIVRGPIEREVDGAADDMHIHESSRVEDGNSALPSSENIRNRSVGRTGTVERIIVQRNGSYDGNSRPKHDDRNETRSVRSTIERSKGSISSAGNQLMNAAGDYESASRDYERRSGSGNWRAKSWNDGPNIEAGRAVGSSE